MADTLKVIFPSGHLGASAGDSGGVTMLRVIAAAFGSGGDDNGWSWPEKYGANVENDVFLMRPDYMDEECECGFRDRIDAWHERNHHAPNCYHVTLREREAAWDAKIEWDDKAPLPQRKSWTEDGPEWAAYRARPDQRRKAHRKIAATLCRERKIAWRGGWGSAVHCDCGVDDALKMWMEWERHGERCPHALPNFWFKPTGLRVSWYKYIGRDMRSNGAEAPADMLAQIFATHPTGMTPDEAFALLAERTEETRRGWDAMLAHLAATLPPNVVLR